MRFSFFSIAMVLFVYILIFYFYVNNVAICKHSILPGFEDLRYVSRYINYYQNGDDIYVSNLNHTPYVYPRFSIILFSLFSFSFISLNVFSIFLICCFLSLFYLLIEVKNKFTFIFYTLFLLSPAILLLLERMNIDLIIFLVLLVMIFFRKQNVQSKKVIYLFYLIVCILSLVKIYPIILLALLPFENTLTKKARIGLFAFSIFIFTSVNLIFYKDYIIMLKNIPQPSELAFGRFVLFNEYLSGIFLKIVSLFPFILFLLFFLFQKSNTLLPIQNEVKMTKNFLMFLIGGSIYSFSFIMSNNYDYRLVFLILTIPFILQNYHNKKQLYLFLLSIIIVLYTSVLHLYVLPFQNYFQWLIGRNLCMVIKYFSTTYLASYFVSFYLIQLFNITKTNNIYINLLIRNVKG